jgi:hypothetical protein
VGGILPLPSRGRPEEGPGPSSWRSPQHAEPLRRRRGWLFPGANLYFPGRGRYQEAPSAAWGEVPGGVGRRGQGSASQGPSSSPWAPGPQGPRGKGREERLPRGPLRRLPTGARGGGGGRGGPRAPRGKTPHPERPRRAVAGRSSLCRGRGGEDAPPVAPFPRAGAEGPFWDYLDRPVSHESAAANPILLRSPRGGWAGGVFFRPGWGVRAPTKPSLPPPGPEAGGAPLAGRGPPGAGGPEEGGALGVWEVRFLWGLPPFLWGPLAGPSSSACPEPRSPGGAFPGGEEHYIALKPASATPPGAATLNLRPPTPEGRPPSSTTFRSERPFLGAAPLPLPGAFDPPAWGEGPSTGPAPATPLPRISPRGRRGEEEILATGARGPPCGPHGGGLREGTARSRAQALFPA